MFRRSRTLWLVALIGLAGCGDGSMPAITNPSELPPLTESDRQAFREQDAKIEDEERGQPVLPTKKKSNRR